MDYPSQVVSHGHHHHLYHVSFLIGIRHLHILGADPQSPSSFVFVFLWIVLRWEEFCSVLGILERWPSFIFLHSHTWTQIGLLKLQLKINQDSFFHLKHKLWAWVFGSKVGCGFDLRCQKKAHNRNNKRNKC